MVFLEAQACGTPVVSCHTGGIPEAVEHEKTGLLVPQKAPDLLADALITLLSDSELRNSIGANGVAAVANNFDVEKQCVKLSNIYRSLRQR